MVRYANRTLVLSLFRRGFRAAVVFRHNVVIDVIEPQSAPKNTERHEDLPIPGVRRGSGLESERNKYKEIEKFLERYPD